MATVEQRQSTVWWVDPNSTRWGSPSKYHADRHCGSVSDSELDSGPVDEAEDMGLDPCRNCILGRGSNRTVYHGQPSRGAFDTRRCYHFNSGCQGLVQSKTIREATISEAEDDLNLSPCGICTVDYSERDMNNRKQQPCPVCGEPTKDIPHHLRVDCDG